MREQQQIKTKKGTATAQEPSRKQQQENISKYRPAESRKQGNNMTEILGKHLWKQHRCCKKKIPLFMLIGQLA
jgi:hypothetical protein